MINFTPNNDGINPLLAVRLETVLKSLKLIIVYANATIQRHTSISSGATLLTLNFYSP